MRLVNQYIVTIFLSIILIACNSRTEPVSARPGPPDNSGTFGAIRLDYADTTSAEWRQVVARLDSFYQVQTRTGFNGSVLIGYGGKILYERYFGFADRESKRALDRYSAVQLASVTKTFTGASILYLHQQKYLNIDDPVQHYLPSFPYPKITLRMLLNHRSGLPDYLHWMPKFLKSHSKPVYNDHLLKLLAQHKPPLEFRPDTRFKYSNTNYALLASVIEVVSGMSYKEFMSKYIFEPLGMYHTFVFDPADGLPDQATISYKYNWVRDAVMFADGVYGDKGIYSTPQDMYRWDQSFYQNRLLDNETMELAYGPCSFEKPGIKNYGLGWRMLCYPDGYKVIYHNGWWHGNNTCFYRFIKDNFTIIVLGNKYNKGIYRQPPVLYSILKNTDSTGDFGGED
jgi:CubicO group peptidase (beta-lactamase class C family)